MLFNSFEFLIFFPLTTILFFLLPYNKRWVMLLAASCFFYMWFIPSYILILAFTIIVDYNAALHIEATPDPRRKKLYLLTSMIANVGVLAYFKYFNFFNGNLAELAKVIGWNYPVSNLAIILPIGLSFHTFQAMGYTIDVYRGQLKAEKHFGIFALFVMFYPQLVAGPIERPQNLLHQFHEKQDFQSERALNGLKLMAWGLFKKVVIADRLAAMIGPVFAHPEQYDGVAMTAATIFFAYQIYCDFSGYSDIGIGAAQVLGFKLMTNFDRPYSAKSISEFWRRWHISLSTWFRDYIYYPLGGNRVSVPRWYLNLMIVFLISGLWHGANFTYIAWGALHGFYLICGAMTLSARKHYTEKWGLERVPWLTDGFSVLFTFALVCLGWIFFRAQSMHDALYMVSHLGTGWSSLNAARIESALMLGKPAEFLLAIAAILFMKWVEGTHSPAGLRQLFIERPVWVRWTLYYFLILAILLVGEWEAANFIYFQF